MNLKPLTCIAASVLLAACGGSNGGSSVTEPVSFEAQLSEFRENSVVNAFVDGTDSFVPISTLEAAGGATYSGQAIVLTGANVANIESNSDALEGETEPTLVGSATLETSFAGGFGSISGSLTGFVDSEDNAKNGEITIEPGIILGTSETTVFAASTSGVLSGAGAGNGDYKGELAGFFPADGGLIGFGAETLIGEEPTGDYIIAIAAE